MEAFQKPNVLPVGKNKRSLKPQEAKFFCSPLNDSEIIEIQNLFMTPKIHQLSTKNIITGRELLEKFAYSLNYQKVGLISTVDFAWKQEAVNIYKLAQEEYRQIDKLYQSSVSTVIEKLCTEISFIDFVWIEITQKLCAQISKNEIQEIAQNLNSQGQVPVIMVSYLQANENV